MKYNQYIQYIMWYNLLMAYSLDFTKFQVQVSHQEEILWVTCSSSNF